MLYLSTITREEHYMLSYGDPEYSGELVHHICIGDRHVDR